MLIVCTIDVIWWKWYSVIFLSKTHNPSLIVRKTSDKSHLQNIVRNILPILLKIVRIIKSKVWEIVTSKRILRWKILRDGRKPKTNQDSILKSRDITLLTKVCLVKAMVFPVVMYGCESWTIKEIERQRTDAFELWFWRRLLRVPWTAGRSTSPS